MIRVGQAKKVQQARLLGLRALTVLTALSLASLLSATPAVATTALEPSVTFNGPVYALAQSGDTLYVGGNFSSVDGQPRSNIAAVDEQDGSLLATAPDTNGAVYALAVAGSHLYAGGHFTTADGELVSNLAAFGLESGGLDASFKAEPNETVYALLPVDESLYVGGAYSSIGGQSYSHLAVVQDATGTASEVNLDPGDIVYALASSGTTLYVGGSVATYGGENYAKVTAYETVSNKAVAGFSTRVEGPIRTLAVSASEVYLGGEFNEVDGQQRANIAAVNRENGSLESAVNVNVQSDFGATANPPGPFALAVLGRTLFIGGDFDTVGELSTDYLAAVDAASGEPLAIFQPNPSSQVERSAAGLRRVHTVGRWGIHLDRRTAAEFAGPARSRGPAGRSPRKWTWWWGNHQRKLRRPITPRPSTNRHNSGGYRSPIASDRRYHEPCDRDPWP